MKPRYKVGDQITWDLHNEECTAVITKIHDDRYFYEGVNKGLSFDNDFHCEGLESVTRKLTKLELALK